MIRRVVPGSGSRLTVVDHEETYGRHILEKCVQGLDIDRCVDLGCGSGDDLFVIKKHNPKTECIGVDFGDWNKQILTERGIKAVSLNIENQPLPFDNESIDFFALNQVLEHTKEIYWINHEIFRCLKIGGHLYLGVPNVLSLHNRLLGLWGVHPTQAKMLSGHIRCFSKKDTLSFYMEIAGTCANVTRFYGAQFYPFPKSIARLLASIFPALAFSIFFLIRKTEEYDGQFLQWPDKASLESNFYTGNNT